MMVEKGRNTSCSFDPDLERTHEMLCSLRWSVCMLA